MRRAVAPPRWSPYAHVVEAGSDGRATVLGSTTAWAEGALGTLTALPGVRRAGIAVARWGFDRDTADTVALCMSELVTNSVLHAASGCRVQVTNDAGTVTVEVRDAGPGTDLRPPDASNPLRVDGRGLQLVDALASRWGSSLDGSGFSAWFMMDS